MARDFNGTKDSSPPVTAMGDDEHPHVRLYRRPPAPHNTLFFKRNPSLRPGIGRCDVATGIAAGGGWVDNWG